MESEGETFSITFKLKSVIKNKINIISNPLQPSQPAEQIMKYSTSTKFFQIYIN